MTFRFYGHNPLKKGWRFSNFSNHPVTIDGKTYPTTEHYFQSMKFVTTDSDWAESIRVAKTPYLCKIMGGSRDHPLRKDWERIKDNVMRRALVAKAEQHQDFLKELLNTQDQVIIEASPTDYYWGEGKTKTGKNMLGILLMELREKIKNNN
jgi:N-glycosidase YbiA